MAVYDFTPGSRYDFVVTGGPELFVLRAKSPKATEWCLANIPVGAPCYGEFNYMINGADKVRLLPLIKTAKLSVKP